MLKTQVCPRLRKAAFFTVDAILETTDPRLRSSLRELYSEIDHVYRFARMLSRQVDNLPSESLQELVREFNRREKL